MSGPLYIAVMTTTADGTPFVSWKAAGAGRSARPPVRPRRAPVTVDFTPASHSMRLLYVHERFGALAGAEANAPHHGHGTRAPGTHS